MPDRLLDRRRASIKAALTAAAPLPRAFAKQPPPSWTTMARDDPGCANLDLGPNLLSHAAFLVLLLLKPTDISSSFSPLV
jgi:hypothetical protein